MSADELRIATRKSPLAMWQAEHVAAELRRLHPQLTVSLVGMSTRGDRVTDRPLAGIGGKALFVKELERGIEDGDAEIAVHSMKDVPGELPEGMHIPAILAREEPWDAFVANHYPDFASLPEGAHVGTGSLRRECQLRARRPDLVVSNLRGNVQTRLRKLDDGVFDAIVLAASGLRRLELGHRISNAMSPTDSLPAVGQGALGIECRVDDERVNELVAGLTDPVSHERVRCERAVNRRLGGSCDVPIGAYACIDGEALWLRAMVGRPDGTRVLRAEGWAPWGDGEALGWRIAGELIEQGAEPLLAELGAR
jgi:hydroxymethylbilane synthase